MCSTVYTIFAELSIFYSLASLFLSIFGFSYSRAWFFASPTPVKIFIMLLCKIPVSLDPSQMAGEKYFFLHVALTRTLVPPIFFLFLCFQKKIIFLLSKFPVLQEKDYFPNLWYFSLFYSNDNIFFIYDDWLVVGFWLHTVLPISIFVKQIFNLRTVILY